MRGNVHIIAGFKSRFAAIGKSEPGAALHQQHPFGFVLVIPKIGRRSVAMRHNALDAHGRAVQKRFKGF